MNHLEVFAAETYVSDSEKNWLIWVKDVERILGHSLDGDQDVDGYSLDHAYDAFKAGQSALGYAANVVTQ